MVANYLLNGMILQVGGGDQSGHPQLNLAKILATPQGSSFQNMMKFYMESL